jgi:hypothetical protein
MLRVLMQGIKEEQSNVEPEDLGPNEISQPFRKGCLARGWNLMGNCAVLVSRRMLFINPLKMIV